jgi:hypothetical protein
LALAACASAPEGLPNEAIESTTSALDPHQLFEPVNFKFTLKQVSVLQAREPYQYSWTYPGLPTATFQQGEDGSCINGSTVKAWTPDTGFHYAAQLGVLVTPTEPGVNAGTTFNWGNPSPAACDLGTVTNGAPLSACKSSAFQYGGMTPGQPLSIKFSVNPGDNVTLGLGLSNIGSFIPTSVTSSLATPNNGDLANAAANIKNFSDGAQLVGAAVTVGGADAAGAVIGLVGAIGSVAGDVLGVIAGAGGTCSAFWEANAASSCNGGLLAGPALGCNAPPDTMMLRDPAALDANGWPSAFTANRLIDMTAAGPATFEFESSYAFNAGAPGEPSCKTRSATSSQPTSMLGCASDVKLQVTIERDWTNSLAASAKSGDIAVVRSPGVIDAFAEDNYADYDQATLDDLGNAIPHYWGSGASFQSQMESASAVKLQAQGVDKGTVPTVVSRSPTNLDLFWIDKNGSLNTAYESTTNGTWNLEQIVAPTYSLASNGSCTGHTVVPADGAVTATARTPANLDAFFVGTDGNVYDEYWSTGMGTLASGLPRWGSTATTTGPCWGTGCVGSGAPGGGVAAISRNPSELDVFYIGKDGGLWTTYWTDGAAWTTGEITGPGVALPGAHVTATARTSETIDVFFLDISGTLRKSSWSFTGNAWGTTTVTGSAGLGQSGGLVSAVARQSNDLDVVFAGKNGELEWATWSASAGPWTTAPVVTTTKTLGALSVGAGGLSIVAPDAYSLQAFYLDTNHRLETIAWADPDRCNSLAPVACSSQGEQRQTLWSSPTSPKDPVPVSGESYFYGCAGMSTGGGSSSGGGYVPPPGAGGGLCGGKPCLKPPPSLEPPPMTIHK